MDENEICPYQDIAQQKNVVIEVSRSCLCPVSLKAMLQYAQILLGIFCPK